jgi:hypothetical protein
MSVAIDANIVKALFQESTRGSHAASASPADIFAELATEQFRIAVDSGGQMLNEWMSCTNSEWFEAWYGDFVGQANVVQVTPGRHTEVLRHMRSTLGFPTSRDVWLVRTACTEAADYEVAILLSDDLDFFDPTKKSAGARVRTELLQGGRRAPVRKYLKKHGVSVDSAHLFLR